MFPTAESTVQTPVERYWVWSDVASSWVDIFPMVWVESEQDDVLAIAEYMPDGRVSTTLLLVPVRPFGNDEGEDAVC